MKKIFVFLIAVIPFFLNAQDCTFFDDVIIKVEKTNINTTNSDFGPGFVGNELWYSAYSDKEIRQLSRGITKGVFYNLFASPVDNSGIIAGEKQIHLEEISKGYHAGPVSYCQATKELFVTLSNFENPDVKNKVFQKADIRLKIIVVKKVNGNWTFIEELPFCSSAYSVGHPAISVTGDTLFFSSNIPDFGFGKTDIYMSVRENGAWGKVVNLGEQINTKYDEMFPFYSQGNVLVFASNGRADVASESFRNLDLYYSCFSENGLTEPKPISELNTSKDDFGLIIHQNEELGYYASRKTGGMGDDDIYKVLFERTAKKEIAGKVIDDVTEELIAGAMVVLADCDGKEIANVNTNAKGEFLFEVEPVDCLKAKASKLPFSPDEQKVEGDYVVLRLKGEYNLELLVVDKNTQELLPNATVKFSDNMHFQTNAGGLIKRSLARNTNYLATTELEGYMNESATFTTKGVAFGTIKETLYVEKVKVGQTFALENIYYDFDKWDILPESEIELNKLIKILNDNPSWKVELGSHTDARGSDSYNEWLSQKRSDSAVGYIIANGISSEAIVAKGYGESQLVNRCKNGVNCSDAEHRKNRRTEFKILGMD